MVAPSIDALVRARDAASEEDALRIALRDPELARWAAAEPQRMARLRADVTRSWRAAHATTPEAAARPARTVRSGTSGVACPACGSRSVRARVTSAADAGFACGACDARFDDLLALVQTTPTKRKWRFSLFSIAAVTGLALSEILFQLTL